MKRSLDKIQTFEYFLMCLSGFFVLMEDSARTPVTFFMKYIRVFHPAGQPMAVQIGSRPICASPLKCLEHFRTALAGRVAINLKDEVYKERRPVLYR